MKRWILLPFLLALTILLNAQTLNQAKALFLDGNYEKALPVFKRQLQTKPADGSLNFWYGVCLLQTGKVKDALPFLEKADLKKVQQAKWYLADLHAMLGDFDKAMSYLDGYLSIPSLSAANKSAATVRKDSLQTTIDQLKRVEDILVIDSIIVPKIDMYNRIRLSKASGTLLPANTLFQRMDFDFGHVYLPERNDRAFYADTVSHRGLDLLGRHRLLNGWGEPEVLSSNVNSEANDCNPFFLQDGVTLYFVSNRDGGFGGTDIYVTRLNPATNTFLQPDHLGFPYNSSANEYFLVIDEGANRGYLATDRRNNPGYVTIYTFVPNKEKVMVSGRSPEEIRSLAEIRSIKDTWAGKNVDSLLQVQGLRPDVIAVKKTNSGSFIYINDSITYQSLDEFVSVEAKTQMETYLTKKLELQEKLDSLNDKRDRYATVDSNLQEKLRVEILSLENDIRHLQQELPSLERSARNLEIKALTK